MTRRKEFEKAFSVPKDCEWDGIDAYCWPHTRAPHPYNNIWEGWQAARATPPEGMALVPLDGFVIEKGSDEYKEVIVTGPDFGMQTFWQDDAAYGLIKAMLPAKDAS